MVDFKGIVGVYKKEVTEGLPFYTLVSFIKFDTADEAKEYIENNALEIMEFDMSYELETDMFYIVYKCHE